MAHTVVRAARATLPLTQLQGQREPQGRRDAAMQPQPLHDGFCPPVSHLSTSVAEQSSAGTVGTGIEPQTERASAAFQGTLLPAHAGVGPAQLCAAPAAAPGCVVCAGETIKLQQAESKDKMSVKRCHHKRAEISDCQREMRNGDEHRLNGALWIPEIKGRLSLLQPPCISIPRSKSHYGR